MSPGETPEFSFALSSYAARRVPEFLPEKTVLKAPISSLFSHWVTVSTCLSELWALRPVSPFPGLLWHATATAKGQAPYFKHCFCPLRNKVKLYLIMSRSVFTEKTKFQKCWLGMWKPLCSKVYNYFVPRQ